MFFRRIILSAIFIGLISGSLLSAVQTLGVTSIIYEAESFEVASDHHGSHDHGAHSHSDEAWAPEDGRERIAATFVSNILAAIGFSALLLALMSQLQAQGVTRLSLAKGVLWGLAGFAACFLAPAIGLPPEIPGFQAAMLEHRQFWWVFAVLMAAMGIGLVAFSPMKVKLVGLLCIALPYIVGAPKHEGPNFVHPDPNAVASLERLYQQFIIASTASNIVFWLSLGVLCAWAVNQWVLVAEVTRAD